MVVAAHSFVFHFLPNLKKGQCQKGKKAQASKHIESMRKTKRLKQQSPIQGPALKPMERNDMAPK